MIVIDEYIAARVVGGDWPDDLPDDDLGLPATRHWRLLQALHGGEEADSPGSSTRSARRDATVSVTLTPRCSGSRPPPAAR